MRLAQKFGSLTFPGVARLLSGVVAQETSSGAMTTLGGILWLMLKTCRNLLVNDSTIMLALLMRCRNHSLIAKPPVHRNWACEP